MNYRKTAWHFVALVLLMLASSFAWGAGFGGRPGMAAEMGYVGPCAGAECPAPPPMTEKQLRWLKEMKEDNERSNHEVEEQRNACMESIWEGAPDSPIPIQIVDESQGAQKAHIAASAAELCNQNSYFLNLRSPYLLHTLVPAVTKHVAMWMEKNNIRIGKDNKEPLLQFVMWPLTSRSDSPFAPMPSLDMRSSSSSDGCRITSPWLDLVFERTPVPRLRAVVRWNERQLLVDQAMLAGARNVPPGMAMPLQGSKFMPGTLGYNREPGELKRFTKEYDDIKRQHRKIQFDGFWKQHRTKSKEEITSILTKKLEEMEEEIEDRISVELGDRIPADLLWLFRRTSQIDLGSPFDGDTLEAMGKAREKSVEPYTKLVIALIDRCLASELAPEGTTLQYNSIIDITDQLLLDQYKIDSLTKE